MQSLLNLGNMQLSGVFPEEYEEVNSLPLELAQCTNCGLMQLLHEFDVDQLYGDTYGYRSGLNLSMVKHLKNITSFLTKFVTLNVGDRVLDIGSNDGTLLGSYDAREGILFTGVDPSSTKFSKYYRDDIERIPMFFSKETFPHRGVKIITSIAMFYDLPDPTKFVSDIYDVLADDGVWFTEQSYLPSMIKAKSFDTICHEHLEYYCLDQIKRMCDGVGLKIVDIRFNNVNGGSFNLTITKKSNSKLAECTEKITEVLNDEHEFFKTDPINNLCNDIAGLRVALFKLFDELKGQRIHGYGASTKGNVLLQYFGIDRNILEYIGEVNEFKFGKVTPGTKVPIISDSESKKMKPSYYFVLPWHFRDNIIEKERDYLSSGGKLIFPLPTLEIVSMSNGELITKTYI